MDTKLSLKVQQEIIEEARALGIDVAHVAEKGIASASKLERNRRWVEANRDALNAYEEQIATEGLPLEKHRLF